MHLEQYAAVVFNGGTNAEAGHRRQRMVRQAMYLHHEDAGRRRTLVHDPQVQRREADGAAQLAAMLHMARDAVRMTEQIFGMFEVAGFKRGAHLG